MDPPVTYCPSIRSNSDRVDSTKGDRASEPLFWIAATTSTYYNQALQFSKAVSDRDCVNKYRRILRRAGRESKGDRVLQQSTVNPIAGRPRGRH
jgi:hypothetical protein